ncbi:MAG: hypothetical protein WC348_03205 [Patescibacteria group bacterium]|jgi:hypothetical protein
MKFFLKRLLGSLLAIFISAETLPSVCKRECLLEKKTSPETHRAQDDFGYPLQTNISATTTAEITASGPTGPTSL